jgi:two-component system OmpR family response regulator
VIEVGEMRIDPATHAVHVEEKSIALTPTEFRILAALAARPKQVMRRSALIAAAWPAGGIVHDNTLDSYVARIRRKIRDEGFESTIATVRGVGYRIG